MEELCDKKSSSSVGPGPGGSSKNENKKEVDNEDDNDRASVTSSGSIELEIKLSTSAASSSSFPAIESGRQFQYQEHEYPFIPVKCNPEFSLSLSLASTIKQFVDEFQWGISLTEFEAQFKAKFGYFPRFSKFGYRSPWSPIYSFLFNEEDICHVWRENEIISRRSGVAEVFIFPRSFKGLIPNLKTIFEPIWSLMLVPTSYLRPPWSIFDLWYDVEEVFQLSKYNVLKNWGLDLAQFVRASILMCRPQNYELELRYELFGGVTIPMVYPRPGSPHFHRLKPHDKPKLKNGNKVLSVPEFCIPLGVKIASVNNAIKENEIHEVNFPIRKNPDFLGAQKVSYKSEFQALQSRIFEEYDRDTNGQASYKVQVNPETVITGLYVMIKGENSNIWGRGILYKKLSDIFFAVYLIDWATFRIVSCPNIYYMPKRFEFYPAIGILCRFIQNQELLMKYGESSILSKEHLQKLEQYCGNKTFAVKFMGKKELVKDIFIWDIEVLGEVSERIERLFYSDEYHVKISKVDIPRCIYDLKPSSFTQTNDKSEQVKKFKDFFDQFLGLFPLRDGSYDLKPIVEYSAFINRGETLTDKGKLLNLFPISPNSEPEDE